MKQRPEANRLCLSCRRHCKQSPSSVIASCPRYYPGPKPVKEEWRQLELGL
ncbi:MAG: hypothetical protein PHG20_03970 [Geobacteraceae bacterium]|nr:hypothetical protein [Geobacteraceae bacterium]